MIRFRKGTRLDSPVSGKTYVIENVLGAGGFGAAYCATTGDGDRVCVKVTDHSISWHREAYMAELLAGHPRVVEVHEAFPVIRRGTVSYAIAMELADGTLADAVAKGGQWSEHRVVSQLRGLLGAVDRLHASGALHRDITPANVFVCGPKSDLKLGDFGIARHGPKKGVPAGTFAPWFVDSDLYYESRTRWTVGDDLWQVGQLAAVLLTAELRPISTREVKDLPCSDGLKLAIRRAIGEPSHRYADARALGAAFGGTELEFGRLRSLKGRTVVFTGPLDVKRGEAKDLAEKAGARVLNQPSGAMDVLVVGSDSPLWIAGSSGGVKVLEALALRERGVPMTFINGMQFMRLVQGARGA